jgi:hypothetical protein
MKIAGVRLNAKNFKKVGNKAVKQAIVGARKLAHTGEKAGKVVALSGALVGQPEIVSAGMGLERLSGRGAEGVKTLQRIKKDMRHKR